MKYYLAIDLGATSGRHIVGHMENGEMVLDEIYRFKTGMTRLSDNHLIWETDRLFNEIKAGIKIAFEKYKEIESLAIDTWGVDYVLLKGDKEVKPTYAYRDDRTKDDIEIIHNKIGFEALYKSTGIQFQPFNTIYQLHDDMLSGRLEGVSDFLTLPTYFTYLLTGVKIKEYTIESTGGYVNTDTLQYDKELLAKLNLPMHLFTNISKPGTLVSKLKDSIAKEVGGNTNVKICASHDTASAFEAIEFDEKSIMISSGTWSLIGTKIKNASTSDKSRIGNFANEGGVGYFRYLKNIMGMWLVNEIQRKVNIPFVEIVEMAKSSTYKEIFDVNDPSLSSPIDMEKAIIDLLAKNNKPLPKDLKDVFASIYHSLAYSYKLAVESISDNLNQKFENLYIVGGGAKNQFLNELTKQYTGLNVIALPIEATVLGNIKVQMK